MSDHWGKNLMINNRISLTTNETKVNFVRYREKKTIKTSNKLM